MRGAPLVALLWSCAGDPEPEPAACDPDWVTWENFAAGQVKTWCTPCHSAALVGDDRLGAPPEVDFDTLADTREWGDRIAVRLAQDTMPPAGGLTDEERSLLATWAACGAPGTEPPTTPDPCATEIAWPGDAAPPPADLCDGWNAVEGSVAGTAGVDLSCLCRIGGDLRPTGADATFDRLRSVGGDLVLDAASGVVALSAPALVSIGGSLEVVASAAETVSLPGVTDVGGSVLVDGNPALRELHLERIGRVGGDYRLSGNPALAVWGGAQSPRVIGGSALVIDDDALTGTLEAFGRVEDLGGDVVFRGNDGITELFGFQVLTAVPGRVEIADNGALVLIETLPDLTTIGAGLRIEGHPALTEVSGSWFLGSVGADAALRIAANPALLDLPPFPVLTGAGAIEVVENPALRTLPTFAALQTVGSLELGDTQDWTSPVGLEALRTVTGDLWLHDHARLADLTPLHGLVSVDRLRLHDNPLLPQAEIDALIDAIDELGSVEASGNGP